MTGFGLAGLWQEGMDMWWLLEGKGRRMPLRRLEWYGAGCTMEWVEDPTTVCPDPGSGGTCCFRSAYLASIVASSGGSFRNDTGKAQHN